MADLVNMPKLGFDMAEGTLVRWVKGEGDPVSKGDVLVEIETDKATVEVEAETSGVMRHHLVGENTSVPIGTPIAVIGSADEQIDLEEILKDADVPKEKTFEAEVPVAPEQASVPLVQLPEIPGDGDGRFPGGVRASPVARRLAEQKGIDLRMIQGSGPQGRIVKADVISASPPAPGLPVSTIGPTLTPGETQVVPISKLRDAIGRRMTASKQQLPHFYVTTELNVEPLIAIRKQLNSKQSDETKYSVNDFIVKAAALALREFPNVNASLQGSDIVRHGEVNVGIAVALEDGLMTIVAHNADLKPLPALSQEIREVVGRARSGKVRPDDVEGSTFTISNLGMFDVDHFIAIINPPEAAILAVGSTQEVPVVENGTIMPGLRMKATLSADHRVTDGAEAAQWLQVFGSYLENPALLLV